MRKLKATWTMESQQDLRSLMNNDAARQLADQLAIEITSEIDREILADLRANAGTISTWNTSRPGPPSWCQEVYVKIPVKKYRSIDDPWED